MTETISHGLTTMVYVLHVGGGSLALGSGIVAALTTKGQRLHRAAGRVFSVAMVVMAIFAAVLGVVVPGQLLNVFIAAFTLYLVATAWLAVRRRPGSKGRAEWVSLVVGIGLCAPFLVLTAQLLAGLPPLVHSALPLRGPIVIAIEAFTFVLTVAAVGDLRVVLAGGLTGASRIARHLWRMCVGLTLASGSAFTNGFARLLPGPYHVPSAFFFPQFLPLILLAFWMVRVRFTASFSRDPLAQAEVG